MQGCVMGSRGPIPKRSSERIRTNKESQPEKVAPSPPRRRPNVRPHWHPIASRWYRSLGESVSAHYFEPSDWAFAAALAAILTKGLDEGNAAMVGKFTEGSARLLTTEADRRRNHIEIGWPGGPARPDAAEPDEFELPPLTVVPTAAAKA